MIALDNGTLRIALAENESNLALVAVGAGDSLQVEIDGTAVGGSFLLAAIDQITIDGNENPNSFDLSGVPQGSVNTITVNTYGGNDTVIGSMAQDIINGGAGDDVLLGGGQQDSLTGASGADLLLGNSGNDTLTGTTGEDSVYGQSGYDFPFGFAVPENVSLNSTVGTITAADPATTFSIVAGNTGNAFSISSTGKLTTQGALDFDTTPTYELTLSLVNSAGEGSVITVDISVIDVPGSDSDLSSQPININADSDNDFDIDNDDDAVEDSSPAVILYLPSGTAALALARIAVDQSLVDHQVRFQIAAGFSVWLDAARATQIGDGSLFAISALPTSLFVEATSETATGGITVIIVDQNGNDVAQDFVVFLAVANSLPVVTILPTYEIPAATVAAMPTQEQAEEEAKRLIFKQFKLSDFDLTNDLNGYSWTKIQIAYENGQPTIDGVSGWIVAWKNDSKAKQKVAYDFSKSEIRFMAFYIVLSSLETPKVKISPAKIVLGPANTTEHETWHTDGVPKDWIAKKKAQYGVTLPDKIGYTQMAKDQRQALLLKAFSLKGDPEIFDFNAKSEFSKLLTEFYFGKGKQKIDDAGSWHGERNKEAPYEVPYAGVK